MTEAKNGGKYEGYLESPCTCILSLKRVYNTIIKYIFSERTLLSRHFSIILIMFHNIDIATQGWQPYKVMAIEIVLIRGNCG